MDWLKNLELESADPMSRKFWREDVQKIKDATKRGFQVYDDLYANAGKEMYNGIKKIISSWTQKSSNDNNNNMSNKSMVGYIPPSYFNNSKSINYFDVFTPVKNI